LDSPRNPTALPEAGSRSAPALLLALLLAATALVHGLGLGGEPIGDDRQIVGRDPNLGEIASLGSYFVRPYWELVGQEEGRPEWRPLSAAARSLAWRLGDARLWALDALGLLAHLAATGAAFLLARRLLSGEGSDDRRRAPWIAVGCAALFGLHPVHVEPAAWPSALHVPLAGALVLAAACAWVRWRESGSAGLPLACCVWFALALLAHEGAIVLLPALFVIDLVRAEPRSPSGDEALRIWGPLVGCLVLWFVCRALVFASPWGGFFQADAGSTLGVGPGRLALLRLEVLGGSLGLLVWPSVLTPFRTFRPELSPADPALLAAVGWSAGLVVLALVLHRRRRWSALSAVALLVAFLLPAPVDVGDPFPLRDRGLYLAVFGFALGVALLAARFGRAGALAFAVLLAVHGGLSARGSRLWRDEVTLFEHAAAHAPRSPRVQWELGRTFVERYRETGDPGDLAGGIGAYERALDLLEEAREPGSNVFATSRDYLQANLGHGWCLLLESEAQGFTVAAPIAQFEELERRIVELRERTAEARSLGIRVRSEDLELVEVQTAIGVGYLIAGDLDAAEAALERALAEDPRYPEAHLTLGRVLMKRREWQLARRHFERARESRPRHLETQVLLAQALQSEGRLAEADRLALAISDGTRPEPHLVRAAVALGENDPHAALEQVDRALAIEATSGQAWYLRGQAFLVLAASTSGGETEEPHGGASGARQHLDQAVRALRRAVREMPESFEAHYDLGITLVNLGGAAEGLAILARAYALCESPELIESMPSALSEFPHTEPEPLRELAAVALAHGELDQAARWLARALEIDPDHAGSIVLRSRVLRRRGLHDESVTWMRRAIELDGDSFVLHAELARHLLSLGRGEEARAVIERALELGPPEEWPAEMARGASDALREELGALGTPGDS